MDWWEWVDSGHAQRPLRARGLRGPGSRNMAGNKNSSATWPTARKVIYIGHGSRHNAAVTETALKFVPLVSQFVQRCVVLLLRLQVSLFRVVAFTRGRRQGEAGGRTGAGVPYTGGQKAGNGRSSVGNGARQWGGATLSPCKPPVVRMSFVWGRDSFVGAKARECGQPAPSQGAIYFCQSTRNLWPDPLRVIGMQVTVKLWKQRQLLVNLDWNLYFEFLLRSSRTAPRRFWTHCNRPNKVVGSYRKNPAPREFNCDLDQLM